MPGEDRLRRDEELCPALPRHEAGEQGDNRPIRPREARAGDLSAKHSQLVAQNEDLSVLGGRVHPVHPYGLEHAMDQSVEEGQSHGW